MARVVQIHRHVGTSAETKPLVRLEDGEEFYEDDTKKTYIWRKNLNNEKGTWIYEPKDQVEVLLSEIRDLLTILVEKETEQ